jgi:hypothetical protein
VARRPPTSHSPPSPHTRVAHSEAAALAVSVSSFRLFRHFAERRTQTRAGSSEATRETRCQGSRRRRTTRRSRRATRTSRSTPRSAPPPPISPRPCLFPPREIRVIEWLVVSPIARIRSRLGLGRSACPGVRGFRRQSGEPPLMLCARSGTPRMAVVVTRARAVSG